MSRLRSDLLDVSVWVALSVETHEFHSSAKKYWIHDSAQEILFCRTTALGLVRVCCNPHTLGSPALSLLQAWTIYRRWRLEDGVILAEEQRNLESELQLIIKSGILGARKFTDAYLAAFAISSSARLVTFDSDFTSIPGLDCLLLTR